MQRFFLVTSAIGGMLSVALGAFAAHALKNTIDAHYLGVFETGARYQMYHSLALLGLSVFMTIRFVGLVKPMLFLTAQWLMVFGVILFSGSLYLLVLLQQSWFGMVTPIGGVLLITAWCCMALGFFRLKEIKGKGCD